MEEKEISRSDNTSQEPAQQFLQDISMIDKEQFSFDMLSPLVKGKEKTPDSRRVSQLFREDVRFIDQEQFDFDLVSPDGSKAEADDEVFFGPVGFSETCAAVSASLNSDMTTVCKPFSPLNPAQFAEMIKEAHTIACRIKLAKPEETNCGSSCCNEEISQIQLPMRLNFNGNGPTTVVTTTTCGNASDNTDSERQSELNTDSETEPRIEKSKKKDTPKKDEKPKLKRRSTFNLKRPSLAGHPLPTAGPGKTENKPKQISLSEKKKPSSTSTMSSNSSTSMRRSLLPPKPRSSSDTNTPAPTVTRSASKVGKFSSTTRSSLAIPSKKKKLELDDCSSKQEEKNPTVVKPPGIRVPGQSVIGRLQPPTVGRSKPRENKPIIKANCPMKVLPAPNFPELSHAQDELDSLAYPLPVREKRFSSSSNSTCSSISSVSSTPVKQDKKLQPKKILTSLSNDSNVATPARSSTSSIPCTPPSNRRRSMLPTPSRLGSTSKISKIGSTSSVESPLEFKKLQTPNKSLINSKRSLLKSPGGNKENSKKMQPPTGTGLRRPSFRRKNKD